MLFVMPSYADHMQERLLSSAMTVILSNLIGIGIQLDALVTNK